MLSFSVKVLQLKKKLFFTRIKYAVLILIALTLTSSLILNPLMPDSHYSERQDKLASLQNKLLEDIR